MAERTVKLCGLPDAVKQIHDGDRVAFGGFAVYNKAMALTHEIIRAGLRHLTIVGVAHSIEVDMLVGAGCVDAVETSYMGLEKFGLAKNFRRAAQAGVLKITHYPELISWDRFRASQEGLSFWPTYLLGGSDIVKYNDKIIPFPDPITGRQMWAVPAADPDVALIHMWKGDKWGNLQTQPRRMNPQSVDITVSRACKRVIATVEHLVDTEEIMRSPQSTTVPSFRTLSVTHVPHGSHPTMDLDVVATDELHLQLYADACQTEEGFREYLDKYVYGVSSFAQYLELVGTEQVKALERSGYR